MPLYEYKCERCAGVFEVIQKFVDTPLTVHEGCGGTLEKLLSSPALQFKGSGFYITDYAKSGGGKKGGSAEGKSKSEGKSEGKSESKSESKTESKGESKPAAAESTKK